MSYADTKPHADAAGGQRPPSGARRVLIVDDQQMICTQLQEALRDHGYEAAYCLSAPAALEELERNPYSVVVTDVRMPFMDGLALLRRVRKQTPAVSVVVMTAHGSVGTKEAAMRLGAADYLEKPFPPTELALVLAKVFKQRHLQDEVAHLRNELGEQYQLGKMISREPAMRDVFATIRRIAATDATVLILGETGTGKELVARNIHYNSPRRNARFMAINCGALPDTLLESQLFGHEEGAFTGATATKQGIFEAADGGTLLLDEIGNVSPAMQTKLLRTLESMEYTPLGGVETRRCNVRILASTHVDLEAAVERDEFRRDLFYRLNVVPVRLPPLRERVADIPLLAERFIKLHAARLHSQVTRISDEAMRALARRSWPGNVRELEHVIQRALILTDGDEILPEHLPKAAADGLDDDTPLPCNEYLSLGELKSRLIERLERTYLDKVLRIYHGNVRQTAQHAGFSERSIHTKLKQYGLDRRAYK